jgi:3-oxoacyl-[acyl-carrier-protein] synthase II
MTNKRDRRRAGGQFGSDNRRKFQRRKNDRYLYDVDITLEKESAHIPGRLVDINMSGLCADLDSAVPVATDYTLQFSFGKEFCTMAVPITILWSTPMDNGKCARVGVEFAPLGTIEKKVLASCIEELIGSTQNGSNGKDKVEKPQISLTIINNKLLAERGKRRRAVITGLGVVSPIGIGKSQFSLSLKEGRSGIGEITRFDASPFPSKVAAEVKGFDPRNYMGRKRLKQLDLSTQYAVAATYLALEDARLKLTSDHAERTAVIIGTAVGGLDWGFRENEIYLTQGYEKMNPFSMAAVYPNACAGQVCIEFGIKGQADTISSGCASAGSAIGMALDLVQQGKVDIVCVGGAEAPLNPTIFGAMCSAGALTTLTETPRPFDDERDGPALGEGAGVFIVEEYGHALRRNAHIYAEVKGWGSTTDAFSLTRSNPDGREAIRAATQALRNAGISKEEIDYIGAYGIATPSCDWMETTVIKAVFGERAYRLPVSSVHSMVGYGWAAIGALQTVANCLAIDEDFIPPTINYKNPDPLCDLDYVPNKMRPAHLNVVMSNIFGCGKNIVVIIQRVES